MTVKSYLNLGDELMKNGRFDEKHVAINFLKSCRQDFSKETFTRVGNWFDSGINNWATTDVLCMFILSGMLIDKVISFKDLKTWNTAESQWKRRAVPVALVEQAKTSYGVCSRPSKNINLINKNMKPFKQILIGTLLIGTLLSCKNEMKKDSSEVKNEEPNSIIVTQDNFPQAYTNLRFEAIIKKAGGINTFLEMPVPYSDPAKQFVVRMNRDTYYSTSVFDMTDGIFVTIPETEKYVTIQVVDENHETQLMTYGPGRHKLSAKTKHAFVIVRALNDDTRRNLKAEASSAQPFEVKNWDMESFKKVEEAGNLDFSDGYDQSKAFGNKESGQTAYMNYVGVAGGWGGAMVEDNIYQTSPYMSIDGCYEMTFVDPEAVYFWSATVYNGDGYMFNDVANISSEMNPVKNADGTYTIRFGCKGQPNNIPIREGNTTGKFNVLMRHYGPSEMVSNGEDGYDATKLIKSVE